MRFSVPVICSRKNRQSWMDSALLSRDRKGVAILNYWQQLLQIITAFALGAPGRQYSSFQKGKT